MAGVSFGVGDQHPSPVLTKSFLNGLHLRLRAATPSRGVGFMGHEKAFVGQGSKIVASFNLHLFNKLAKHLRDDPTVEAGPMKRTVGKMAGDHVGNPLHASLFNQRLSLQHKARSPGPENHPVAFRAKGHRSILDLRLHRSGSGCEKARTNPRQGCGAGNIICGHHHHPVTAPEPDPICSNTDSLPPGGARGVHRGVGSFRADGLSQLGVAHGQNPKQKLSIKAIPVSFSVQLVDGWLKMLRQPLHLLRISHLKRKGSHQRAQFLRTSPSVA